jgi:hypothetical protein
MAARPEHYADSQSRRRCVLKGNAGGSSRTRSPVYASQPDASTARRGRVRPTTSLTDALGHDRRRPVPMFLFWDLRARECGRREESEPEDDQGQQAEDATAVHEIPPANHAGASTYGTRGGQRHPFTWDSAFRISVYPLPGSCAPSSLTLRSEAERAGCATAPRTPKRGIHAARTKHLRARTADDLSSNLGATSNSQPGIGVRPPERGCEERAGTRGRLCRLGRRARMADALPGCGLGFGTAAGTHAGEAMCAGGVRVPPSPRSARRPRPEARLTSFNYGSAPRGGERRWRRWRNGL